MSSRSRLLPHCLVMLVVGCAGTNQPAHHRYRPVEGPLGPRAASNQTLDERVEVTSTAPDFVTLSRRGEAFTIEYERGSGTENIVVYGGTPGASKTEKRSLFSSIIGDLRGPVREGLRYRWATLNLEQMAVHPEAGYAAMPDQTQRVCLARLFQPEKVRCVGVRGGIESVIPAKNGFKVTTSSGSSTIQCDGTIVDEPDPPVSFSQNRSWERKLNAPISALAASRDQAWAMVSPSVEVQGWAPRGMVHFASNSTQDWAFATDWDSSQAEGRLFLSQGRPEFLNHTDHGCGELSALVWRWKAKQPRSEALPGVGAPQRVILASGEPALLCVTAVDATQPALCNYEKGNRYFVSMPEPETGQTALEQPFSIEGLCGLARVGPRILGLRNQEIFEVVGKRIEKVTDAPVSCPPPCEALYAELPKVSLGGGERSLWLSFEGRLWRQHDGQWLETQPPVGRLASFRAFTDREVWAVGELGAAWFDGESWHRELGVPGSLEHIEADDPSRIWVGGASGVWLGTPRNPRSPIYGVVSAQTQEGPSIDVVRDLAWEELPVEGKQGLMRRTLPGPKGKPPIDSARGLTADREGGLWLWDDENVYRWDGSRVKVMDHEAEMPIVSCGRCLAPLGTSGGYDVWHRLIRASVDTLLPVPSQLQIPEPVAVSATSADRVWVVGASINDALPHLMRHEGDRFEWVTKLPPASYIDVSLAEDGGAWMVGGRTAVRVDGRVWPVSEGVMVRSDVSEPVAMTRFSIPYGSLLSVWAASRTEAWAVGVGGLVVHVSGQKTEAWRVTAKVGGRVEPPWLYEVVGDGHRGVWLVGEAGMLIHHENGRFSRLMVPSPITLTGATLLNESLWVCGPSGLFETRGDRSADLPIRDSDRR